MATPTVQYATAGFPKDSLASEAGISSHDEVLNSSAPGFEHPVQEDEDMADLFGDGGEAEGEDEDVMQKSARAGSSPTPSLPGSDISVNERQRRRALEYEEEEPEAEVAQLREAAVSVPNIPVPNPSDNNHWIIRLPNFVNVDSKPFDTETYVGPDNEYDDPTSGLNIREQSMSIKLQVENTIRWRWVKDSSGQMRKQSNSRIIRWSDGSMSLQLGNELFDVAPNIDTPPASLGLSQSQGSAAVARSQGLTYLVAQHKRAEILQAEAVINGSLAIRPSGMQSATHRKLVRAVGQKHHKATRLIIAPDPTKESEMHRAELLKAQKKSTYRRRKTGEDADLEGKRVGRRQHSGSTRRNRQDIWSDDDDASDGENMAQYTRRSAASSSQAFSKKGKGAGDYEPDEFVVDDEEDEDRDDNEGIEEDGGQDSLDEADKAIERARQARKSNKRKGKLPGEEEDGDEAVSSPPPSSQVASMAITEDSDNEDEGAIRRAGARKARRIVAVGESDEE